jgi:hypothetical protein
VKKRKKEDGTYETRGQRRRKMTEEQKIYDNRCDFARSTRGGIWDDKELFDLDRPSAFASRMNVIGIDPGQNDLMYSSNGHKLSKKQYYEECGFNMTERWRNRNLKKQKNIPLREAVEKANEQSFKRWSVNDLLQAWYERLPLEDKLFDYYGHVQFRQHKFCAYGRKRKCLDSFFNRLLNGADIKSTVIAFGNGKFPTSSRGKRSGPLIGTKNMLAKRIRVICTDEFRSSKVCLRCALHGHKGERKNDPVPHIECNKKQGGFETFVRKSRHELLHCQKCGVWRNRDLSAAETIKRLLEFRLHGEEIPWIFRRGPKWEDVEDMDPSLFQNDESNAPNLLLSMGEIPMYNSSELTLST